MKISARQVSVRQKNLTTDFYPDIDSIPQTLGYVTTRKRVRHPTPRAICHGRHYEVH
jgi:hypothetical protein